MSADFNHPITGDAYADVLDMVRANDVNCITLGLAAATNTPVGAIKWDRSTLLFREWGGASYADLLLAVAGGGTGSATAAGARTNLGLGSMATQNSNAVTVTAGSITGVTLSATLSGALALNGQTISGNATLTGTLTNATLATPAFSGAITGTYTLGGTVTITSPTINTPTITTPSISNPAFSGTATGSYTMGGTGIWNAGAVTSTGAVTASGVVTGTLFTGTATGNNYSQLGAAFVLQPFAVNNQWFSDNILYNGSFRYVVNGAGTIIYFGLPAAGGLTIQTAPSGTAGNVATLTTRFAIDINGNQYYGANIVDGVGTPTIASGFGTGPSIAGKSYAFVVTVGTGAGTTGTVNFGTTYANAPICSVAYDLNSATIALQSSTTQITISSSAVLTAGQKLYITVRGY